MMNYRTGCLLGSLLLMARQVFEFFRLLSDVSPLPEYLLVVAVAEGLLHCVLLHAALTMQRRALTFWLYFGHSLTNIRFYMSLLNCLMSLVPVDGPLVHAALLCAVWHAAYQYLLELCDRRDAVLVTAEEVAPDAPLWERDVDGVFGWRIMADNEKMLASVGSFLTRLWRKLQPGRA